MRLTADGLGSRFGSQAVVLNAKRGAVRAVRPTAKTRRALCVWALALCALLSGCTSGISVDELLASPALTADQSSVIVALEAASDEKTVLKYPTSGDRRAPIQFVDLDADGSNEAVAFYAVSGEFARLGVLKKTDGAWELVSSVEGAGTDVESISVIRLENSAGRFLLVEWSSINSRERQLAAYHLDDGEIALGFEETCSDILVYDADADGFNEFCYITAGSAFEPFKLKFVDNATGAFAVMGDCELSASMISPAHLTAGKLSDGRRALFVDENVSDSEKCTEVFTVADGRLVPVALAEGYDVFELSRRNSEALACGELFGDDTVYIPSRTPPREGVAAPDKWEYLYTVNGDGIAYEGAACVISDYGAILLLPDEWLAGCTVIRDAQSTRLFHIYDERLTLNAVSIKILEIGEDAAPYLADGYELITQSGSYRYYLKGVCPEEDFEYIRRHFALL